MAMKRFGKSEGILHEEYIRETRRPNIPPPKMPIHCPYFTHTKSATGSISSSSSWSSSQESLNFYGTSPESPRLSGLKPQDRLRRIRESFIEQQSRKMEVDEEVDYNRSIQLMEQPTESWSTSYRYSPMSIDNDVTESVRSTSLKLQHFHQVRTKSIPINQRNNKNNYGYPSFYSCERETQSSNRRSCSNKRFETNTDKSSSDEYKIPQWMMPLLNLKPLRQPHLAQRQI